MPVATFSGRQWTINDHVEWLKGRPVAGRPLARIPLSGMRELIRQTQIQHILLTEEAEALGYADRPEVEVPARRSGEALTIEVVHGRFIQQADVPAEEVRAVYDSTCAADEEAFVIPDRVDMLIIIQSEEAAIREAYTTDTELDWTAEIASGGGGTWVAVWDTNYVIFDEIRFGTTFGDVVVSDVGPPPDRFLRGDTDGSGQFTIGDGIQILERQFSGRQAYTSKCEDAGDVDDNGVVNGDDIAGFVRAKLGLPPLGDENQACAEYGGTLEDDLIAFIADLLSP